jgi:hypothetical protein
MTVDNPTAERFKRLDGHQSERVMRDAIDKTFRGVLRGTQGVFAMPFGCSVASEGLPSGSDRRRPRDPRTYEDKV